MNTARHRGGEEEEAQPCARVSHQPHALCQGSSQPEAYLDVMSLWDNNVLVGKQVLYTILGNDVLNLQAQGFRTKQVTTAHCMHHNRAGSPLASVPFPPPPSPGLSAVSVPAAAVWNVSVPCALGLVQPPHLVVRRH